MTKKRSIFMILALILVLPFAVLLSACGESPQNNNNNDQPQDVYISYNLVENGNKYKIESNSTLEGYRISVQNGSLLSVSDIMFEVYANGNLLTPTDYTVSSNLPQTALEYGSDYQVTYTYGEEQETLVVTVSELEIDLSYIATTLDNFNYSEIDAGSQYIDVVQKIDAAMQAENFGYTLSGLKQQGAVEYTENTMQDSSNDTNLTRTYHACTSDGYGNYESFYFEVVANNGYIIKTPQGTNASTYVVYWKVLPMNIEVPIATNLNSLIFDPNKMQAPTLIFGDSASDPVNAKYNNMIEITKQFGAREYYQIEYVLKQEYRRNYNLLDEYGQASNTVSLFRNWTIAPRPIHKAILASHDASYYNYDGNEKRPGWVLPSGYGYLFTNPSYSNNIEVGTATMHVELIESWTFGSFGDGTSQTLSGDNLYNSYTWIENNDGLPISDYDIEFQITKATYSLPTMVHKTLNVVYAEDNTVSNMLSTLNGSPSNIFDRDSYYEWNNKNMLNQGYVFEAKANDQTSIRTKLRTIGSHTITLLYTPSTEHYLNQVEVELTLVVSKRTTVIFDSYWTNDENYSYDFGYTYDGTEKAAPVCMINYSEYTNSTTYVAVQNNGYWVADKNQPIEHPTNAGKYVTVANFVLPYDQYVSEGGVAFSEFTSPVWEIKQVMLPKFGGELPYEYYLNSYYSIDMDEYYFEETYHYGMFKTGSNIVVDYNDDTKAAILHYDYFLKTTHASGYDLSYQKWNGTSWQDVQNIVDAGKYRVCFVFDLDSNYTLIDYGSGPDDITLTDRQYFEFEIYETEYSASGWTLSDQSTFAYTGDWESSCPKVQNLPNGLIATYTWYNGLGGDYQVNNQEPSAPGTYYVRATIQAANISNNNVRFIVDEFNTAGVAETGIKEYTIVKKQINKNEISAHDISDWRLFQEGENSYFDIPENATYSKYIFSTTVVIEDDQHNQVASGQYFEPLTHYTMTVTLKLYDDSWTKDCYELIGANENSEFVYTFDWTTGKFKVIVGFHWEDSGFGNHLVFDNFGLNYDETSDALPSISDISFIRGLPESVSANWQDVLDVSFSYSVWASEEEYQQGFGTTQSLDASTPTESGRHYICEVYFSIKPEYQDRYEIDELEHMLQISWTKP